MRAVPVTSRQVMFIVCGQCPSLHAEGLNADKYSSMFEVSTDLVKTAGLLSCEDVFVGNLLSKFHCSFLPPISDVVQEE